MPELPTGTVTFLFTDLEGSTRLWEEHPEAMRAALARHDEILRDAVTQHDGHVVKTTGDGLHAAFGTAHDAVVAALDAQHGLTDEAWTLPEALRVRMGIHTGEADLRDGDYYGTAVNRAARISAAAHGGQLVVSHATEELVRDGLAGDAELRDLGEHRLRDLARPERVFELRSAGDAADFPPLRTVDAFPGNLPAQLTSFVGRDDDLDDLAKALTDTRLVTVTGVGGVGKTRLAIQLAADVLPRFPDGAWLCELAAATDPDALAQVAAATLGVNPRPGVTLEESIVAFLGTRELLLVLDNCEHLLDAAGALAERVLQSCPAVRIVATSREGLAVRGEQVWPLRSLGVPAADDVGHAADAPATHLFVDRARAARPSFDLDGANADAVAEICRRLDGIPLAIELAAARIEAMSAPEIASLLDERFRLLTGGRRTAVERHQTLRATVDWSYELLASVEQLVLDRLAVFAGTFDAVAATAVVTGDGVEAWDIRDALGALVAKSLVVRDETPAGVTRYQLLETLRQYAREQLDDRGETDIWRRRHAEHYAAFAEEAGPALLGRGELTWRARVGEEIDNLRAAVLWSLEADAPDDVELALRIIAALGYEATMRRSAGIAAWAEGAIEQLAATTPGRRAAVLGAAAFAALYEGNLARTEELARAAMDGGIPDDCPVPVLAPTALAVALSHTGDPTAAIDLMHGVTAERDWTDFDISNMHATTANWATMSGNLVLAQEEVAESLRIAREVDNPSTLVIALYSFGWASATTDPVGALAALEESVALARTGASDVMLASSLGLLGKLRLGAGDVDGSIAALREGFDHAYRDGDRPTFFGNVQFAIATLAELGEHELGLLLYAATIPGATAPGDMVPVIAAHQIPEREAAVEEARRALGDEEFDRIVANGRVMNYDQLAHHVLRELDRMIEERTDA